jgi:hypothetical protein
VRLTLRTLLAYLDDTLDPAQAKLIGQKINESPAAQELISRIKEVVRRRRLTTPTDTNPGEKSDPNTIAEYIDSVLPPEKLAEVEEMCLESDVHLAEIAACHQILTVILSKPALVPPTARERMYGLIHGREAIPYRKATRIAAVDGTAGERAADASEADEALLLGLPLYRRGGPWYYRLLPIGIVAALLIALAAAIWEALPSTPQHRAAASAETRVARTDETAPAPVQKKTAPEPPSPPAPPAKKEEQSPKKEESQEKKASPAVSETPPSSFKGGADVASALPTPKAPPSAADSTKSASAAGAISPPPPRPGIDAIPTAPERAAIGRYVVSGANPSILVSRTDDSEPWHRLIRNGPVYTVDRLVSLPGYRSEIRLPNGVRLVLWGDLPDSSSPVIILESRVILHSSPDFDLDMTLERGRVAISNLRPEGPARIRLRFKDQAWDLKLLDNGSELAAELVGFPDVGFDKNAAREHGPIAGLGLYALEGQANVKAGYTTHLLREPRGPALLIWNNLAGVAGSPRTLNPSDMPPWAKRVPVVSKEVQAFRLAQDQLANRLSAQTPVDVVLQEMLQDQDVHGRILAVYAAGAVDDLPDLLDALANDRISQERKAAEAALRQWLGHSADSDAKLYRAVAAKYRPAAANIIMELLHPYSERQKGQPETYEALIAFLKHDLLPIRELAYSHLMALVPQGRKIPYDPAGAPEQRSAGYDQWKKLIPTGKLPPPPSTAPPTSRSR